MLATTLVREKKSTYTDHDRLFKILIKTFFQEFMEPFFPAILAEVTMNREDKIILIHVEPQVLLPRKFQ